MLGSLARRERRPLWGTLTFVLAIVVGLSLWAAANARGEAIREATLDAELTAQTELAPLLQVRDLTTPITGDRAADLAEGIERSITTVSPIDDVRIFSSLGRILYASDPKFVGTRPSYLRDLTFEVANGRSTSLVRDSMLLTYVPLWTTPGGDVAVAELAQPVGPISAEATATWYRVTMIAGLLMLGCGAMVFVTSRASVPRSAPVRLYAPAVPRRPPHLPALGDTPIYEHSGFRALEEQRADAERRASAVEENFRAVQQRLKDALAHARDLEERLAMNETQHSTSDGEILALRDQLKETSERLHEAEMDNNALRERMSLRQQELEEARRMAAEFRIQSAGGDLRRRLQAADERAAEMERQIDELEAWLQGSLERATEMRFPRELSDIDDHIEIQEDDDHDEPSVVIRNAPGRTTSEKVR
jgi:hypothetical protein